MNTIFKWSGVVALVILAISAVFGSMNGSTKNGKFAGVDPSLFTSLTSLNVVTSDTATSTTAVGCVQTTATSTATPIRLVYSSIATSSPAFGKTSTGVVGWTFGNCP